jgi:DNA-binding NarL/FixJ family response regulator
MTEPIRIVVADDHPLLREGVVHTLSAESDMTVVAEAGTGERALELLRELSPDILLLDIAMPGKGGIETAREAVDCCPMTRVLMLTVSENEDDVMAALKAGARGYVLKGVAAPGLVQGVRAVHEGEVYISPVLASTILYEMTSAEDPEPFDALTDRERQVLELVGEGLTNREIGERLYLAEKTVKHYMTSVLQKLHVRSRVEAALLAAQHQIDSAKRKHP